VLNFLVQDLGCPASLIAVEKKLVMNRLTKRTDILVHTAEGKPVLLVECKAPQVKLGQEVFEQAARYNTVFKVPFLLVTNGMVHYCCKVVHGDGRIEFLSTLPSWPEMSRALSG
jgi:type I site-specific restriction endonuclease